MNQTELTCHNKQDNPYWLKCSNCGQTSQVKEYLFNHVFKVGDEGFRYCPCCGVRIVVNLSTRE